MSAISSNENVFKEATPPYQKALQKNGYDYELKYSPSQPPSNNAPVNERRKRKRNISWFNPPYSNHVKTNVGKEFLHLIDKCFPPENQLHKLLNRSTVKISYSCMPNMKGIIASQNKSIVNKCETVAETRDTCNCRDKTKCPLEGKCQISGVVYQATVTREDTQKDETYVGLTENEFKTRFNGHTSTFNNRKRKASTTLSQYVWSLQDKNIEYSIKWKILARSKGYSTSTKKCNLCLKEKYFIICKPQMATLNNRNELNSECRHRKKHLLCEFI